MTYLSASRCSSPDAARPPTEIALRPALLPLLRLLGLTLGVVAFCVLVAAPGGFYTLAALDWLCRHLPF